MKKWSEVKSEFDRDGTLRDIYVEHIGASVWRRFIRVVRESDYRWSFFHAEEEKELPDTFKEIQLLRQVEYSTTLVIWVEHIQLNCSFLHAKMKLN